MLYIKKHLILIRKSIICLAFFQLYSIGFSSAQAVAISGVNSDSPDGFALVALVDIPAGANIFFTDVTYDYASNIFIEQDINGNQSTANGSVQLTWTGTWTKGTIIRVVETSTNFFTVTAGAGGPTNVGATNVYAGDGFSLSGSDGLCVYTSTSTTDPELNIGEIYGYVRMAATSSDPNPNLDPDCPCSTDFVEVEFNNNSVDGFNFDPSLRGGAVSLDDFNNTANYVTSSSNITLDLTPFSNITFGDNSSLPLPVELTSFSVQNFEDQKVRLMWRTASELDNDYFEIENSLDGINFSHLGTIQGKGTTNIPTDYRFIHNNPNTGMNYYRLKQVDYDGAFVYSQIRAVRLSREKLEINEMDVYPNPAHEILGISLPIELETVQELKYRIYNQMGQLIQRDLIQTINNELVMDVKSLKKGFYTVEIEYNSKVYMSKFVKGY